LEFASYRFSIHGGRQIRSLEPLREGGGKFMGGALLGLIVLFGCACVKLALVISPLVVLFITRVLGVGSGVVE
jgi:VIT1/CCC1 family predicted Fe2+/Mn2+ transporter